MPTERVFYVAEAPDWNTMSILEIRVSERTKIKSMKRDVPVLVGKVTSTPWAGPKARKDRHEGTTSYPQDHCFETLEAAFSELFRFHAKLIENFRAQARDYRMRIQGLAKEILVLTEELQKEEGRELAMVLAKIALEQELARQAKNV
jgi:hypothetical protein